MTNRPNDNRYLALDEYIRLGEPDQADRSHAWKTAIGLQDVDGLRTSDYLLETAKEHIEGRIGITEAERRIESYYEAAEDRTAKETGTNRYLHVDYNNSPSQSAKKSASKCNSCTLSCTLEELALLTAIAKEPTITQKALAEKVGKSERTIKTRTVSLQKKGLLAREGGKKNGRWIVSAEVAKEE